MPKFVSQIREVTHQFSPRLPELESPDLHGICPFLCLLSLHTDRLLLPILCTFCTACYKLENKSAERYLQMSMLAKWLWLCFRFAGLDEVVGAQTTLYCALEESIQNESGKYYDNCRQKKLSFPLAIDDHVSAELWDTTLSSLRQNGYLWYIRSMRKFWHRSPRHFCWFLFWFTHLSTCILFQIPSKFVEL